MASVAGEQWSSRAGFLLASIGFAVGLGNIWRFPYITGENGGAAFVVVYLVCAFAIGVPILIAEVMIGRRGRMSPPGSMRAVALAEGQSRQWQWAGGMNLVAAFLIQVVYCVIAGWVLLYLFKALTTGFAGIDGPGAKSEFDAVLTDIPGLIFWTVLGLAITIRRFGGRQFSAEDLIEQGSLPRPVYEEAIEHLRERRNVLIAGGTGSGKTTLLQALAGVIPEDERILVIEDTTEIQLEAKNLLQMEARDLAGSGLSIRDLVKASLRHRPDRLILGEVRGAEAADLIQALNTGHGGSLSTIHSNDAESALVRLASCAQQGGEGISWPVLCMQVAQAIDFVIHVERRDGRRVVSSAVRVLGAQGDGWETRRFWPLAGR